MKKLIIILVSLSIVSFAQTFYPCTQLNGVVVDFNKKEIAGVDIYIFPMMANQVGVTGRNGNFIIYKPVNKPIHSYFTLIFSKKGYYDTSYVINIDNPIHKFVIREK